MWDLTGIYLINRMIAIELSTHDGQIYTDAKPQNSTSLE